MASKQKELVVLLHGILCTSRTMRKMQRQLEAAGYQVLNIDYPSVQHQIHELASMIARQINAANTNGQRVHLVGFSMGGLIIRALLHDYDIAPLGRVVMIGTPNHGSEVADSLHKFWLYETVYGPAGQQLLTDQIEVNWWQEDMDCELGIIAGDMSLLGGGWWLIHGDNDGLVSVESTKLDGMKDHIVVPCMHGLLPMNGDVISQTIAFLESGRFARRQ